MAAGQGFKTFTTGEVLSAADVNGYLMQGVLVFASAAARDAAITSPQEGQFAYLKDTNVTTYYTGSAWANVDSTGMTNPMTTTGDTIYSSSGSTPARLGIGSTGQVLTVAGGVPTWAAPGASGKSYTLLNTGGTALTGASTITISGISAQDNLFVLVEGASIQGGGTVSAQFNTDSGTNYRLAYPIITYATPQFQSANANTTRFALARHGNDSGNSVNGYFTLQGCNGSGSKMFTSSAGDNGGVTGGDMRWNGGVWNNSASVTSVSLVSQNGNFDAGTIYVYGAA